MNEPNLYVLTYKITGDEKTYTVLDASEKEQIETAHKVLQAWSDLDSLTLGLIPVQVTESYDKSNMPVSLTFAELWPKSA